MARLPHRARPRLEHVYVEGQEYTAGSDNGDLGILLRSYLATSDIEVDWVRARPIVRPEPSVVFGSESPL